MKPPRIRESPPPVLRDEELQRLLSTGSEEQGFEDGRDYPLFRVFIETGARLLDGAAARPRLGARNRATVHFSSATGAWRAELVGQWLVNVLLVGPPALESGRSATTQAALHRRAAEREDRVHIW